MSIIHRPPAPGKAPSIEHIPHDPPGEHWEIDCPRCLAEMSRAAVERILARSRQHQTAAAERGGE